MQAEEKHIYGLLGYPLEHSFSKKYFEKKFQEEGLLNYSYQNFALEKLSPNLNEILSNPCIQGFNVTIPYKKAIIPYLSTLSMEAQSIGAVNVVKVLKNGNLCGYNTDCIGFYKSLLPYLSSFSDRTNQRALIFGNGGVSQAIQFVFKKLKIDFLVVSRSGSLSGSLSESRSGSLSESRSGSRSESRSGSSKKSSSFSLLSADSILSYKELNKEILSSYTILVNATPLGMYPLVENSLPISYEHINPQCLAYDLIYNPETTLFLKRCALQGASIKNGLEMLHLQAQAAWDIWKAPEA